MIIEAKEPWVGYRQEGMKIKNEDAVFYDVKKAPFKVYGVADITKNFRRMPDEDAKKVSLAVYDKMCSPAGVRVRFATNSPYIGIRTKQSRSVLAAPHISRLNDIGFDLYKNVNGKDTFVGSYYPPMDAFEGYEGVITVSDGEMAEYTIHFPAGSEVFSFEIALSKDAHVSEHTPYKTEKPVVFYGSSITHCICASRPGNMYQNVIARELDTDIVNLGFSGQAKGEKAMAEYVASLDMSAFVLDYDANSPTPEHLKSTHEQFYKIVREAHPDIPIIMISYPSTKWHNEEIMQKKDVIIETYLNARKSGDKKVYFIDGMSFFLGKERTDCTVDGSHPNDMGYRKMAERISDILIDVM